MAFINMIAIGKDLLRYSLNLPLTKQFDKSVIKDHISVSQPDKNRLLNQAVGGTVKYHHSKYPVPDPATVEKILFGHPCPLGQGPLICPVDGGVTGDPTGEKAILEHTMYRHDESQNCFEWLPVEKTDSEVRYEVKDIDYEISGVKGAASTPDMCVVYTCQYGRCIVHCSCRICLDKSKPCRLSCGTEVCDICSSQCRKHEIKLPRLFDPENYQFTLVTNKPDSFRYAVPHAGIPVDCVQCLQDVLEHQVLHLVFHLRCRFCFHAAIPFDDTCVLHYSQFEDKEKLLEWNSERSCSKCLKQFSDKQVRTRHEKTEHENIDEKKFKCVQCDKKYTGLNALNHHVATKHQSTDSQKFTCESCGEQFVSKTKLTDHRKSVHEESSSFACGRCDAQFSMECNLKRHTREFHRVSDKNLDFVENLNSLRKLINCEKCGQTFKRKENLKRHVASVHSGESDVQQFSCDKCNKTFNRKDAMKRHIKSQHL